MPGPKKAQRTKGNVKPSSSSQAAQLLAASGHASTGFIGFSQLPAFVPVSEVFDEAESMLDGDFRLVLRKLSKRDAVTKIKALQEFSSLCSSKDEDTVKSVVPFWPRIYNKVAIDVDHKVRELTQKATANLAAKAGKAMAPHLKSIMGTWMVSMCDTYPTVASAAIQAFTSRFPGNKQSEAIRFCVAEITETLLKNITTHTKQTLSDAQTTSEEDMDAKYQRVVSSSLQGLRKVLVMLPSDSVNNIMAEHINMLLQSSALWKHSKSNVPAVKGGVLSLLAVVCQLCPTCAESSISKISPFVFSCLDCVEPSIVSYAWEALLSMVNTQEACWQHVNWQKAVWPKVKKMLESGCSGQAAIIAPCLLPFLSKTPDMNYAQFFESFRIGIGEDSVINVPSELNALIKGFQECMQYTVKSLNGCAESAKIKYLILDQMLIVVQGSLTEPKANLCKTELYANLSMLLIAVGQVDPQTEVQFFSDLSEFTISRLVDLFNEASKCRAPVEANSNDKNMLTNPSKIIYRLMLLLQGLIYQTSTSAARKERVKFSTADDDPLPALGTKTGVESSRKTDNAKLSKSVDSFVEDILVSSLHLATVNELSAPVLYNMFADLLSIYIPTNVCVRLNDSEDKIKTKLSKDLNLEPVMLINLDDGNEVVTKLRALPSMLPILSDDDKTRKSSPAAVCVFIVHHIVPILCYAEKRRSLKIGKSMVTSLFALLQHVDGAAGQDILTTVIANTSEPFLRCLLIEQTLKTMSLVPACKSIVDGGMFAQYIEELANDLVSQETIAGTAESSIWTMLTSVVSTLRDEDSTLVPTTDACFDAVMSSCVSALKQLTEGECDGITASDFTPVTGLLQALLEKHRILIHPLLGELVVTLLKMLLLLSNTLQTEEVLSLEQLWLKGIGLFLQTKADTEIQNVLTDMCKIVQTWVIERVDSFDSLDKAKRISKVLVVSILSSNNGDDGHSGMLDIESRLTQLTLEGTTSEDRWSPAEFDVDAVSTALSDLLVPEPLDIEDEKMLQDYLYVSMLIPVLPCCSQQEDNNISMNLQTAVMTTLFNLSLFEMAMQVQHMVEEVRGEETFSTAVLSDAHILSFSHSGRKIALLETLGMIGGGRYDVSDVNNWKSTLTSKVMRCIYSLNQEQLHRVVDSMVNRAYDERCLFIWEKEFDLSSEILWSLKRNFITNCNLSETCLSEVEASLDQQRLDGEYMGKVFSLALDDLMKQTENRLHYLALCISGFIRLEKASKTADVTRNLSREQLFQQVVGIVNSLKAEGIHLLSSSDASSSVDTSVLEFNVSVARGFRDSMLVGSDHYWETTLCTLVEWLQFLCDGVDGLGSNSSMQALAVSVFELAYYAAQSFKTSLDKSKVSGKEQMNDSVEDTEKLSSTKDQISEKSKTEWEEFFAEGVFSPLLPSFVNLASITITTSTGFSMRNIEPHLLSLILTPLSATASLCPPAHLLSHNLPPRLTASDTSSLSDSVKTLLNHLCPLLMSKERCVEVSAYLLLKTVISEIVKEDVSSESESNASSSTVKEEEEDKSPPEALMSLVESAGHFLDCLKVVQVDDHIVMDAGTEERAQAMGYLLTWRLLLQLFQSSQDELRARYAHYFKREGSVRRLLDHLFRLMPQHPDEVMTEPGAELSVVETRSSEVEWLAIQVYRSCLEIVPALVRAWWVDQDRKASNFVDQFTAQYLSQGLISRQIGSAQGDKNGSAVEGITIKTRIVTREVLAICEMAEVAVTMTITLPEDFPLGKLAVACDKRVGVSQAQWDRWLLQLNIFLQHQNGTIVEGLRLWKANLDKKFAGIEDCMICFSVIHGTNFQLPRLTCRTCRKKFHSACLYKWFSTSQKSSCPLCRELF